MKTIIRNIVNERGNAVKNQFLIINNTNYTFQSYETTIACLHVGSAFIDIDSNTFGYSTTTTRHFLNYLANCLLNHRPTRKEVEKWMKQGFIPSTENCYCTDIDIRIVNEFW